MEPSHLLALVPGRSAGWKYTRHVVELGTLRVPSGRLEASDPFVGLGQGLVFAVPPGDYPVAVTIADVSDAQNGSHLRETYLSVRLAEGAVARVEFLVPDGREAPESDDEYYGVPVDAGTVGFADAEAVARCMPGEATSWYDDVFATGRDDSWFALMDSGEHYVDGAANIVLPLATEGENVVLSHSGWGDGFYPVVGAYDADGTLLSVHIDLQVDEPEDDHDGDASDAGAAEDNEPAHAKPSFWNRLFGKA